MTISVADSFIRNLKYYWNLVHYCFYKLDCKIYFIMAIPVRLLYYLVQRKVYKRSNPVDFESASKVYTNPDIGFAPIFAAWIMTFLAYFFLLGTYALSIIIFGISGNMYTVYFLILLAYLFNYIILFRKDKFLLYFEEFEAVGGENNFKWKMAGVSIFVSGGILVYFAIGAILYFRLK